MVAVAASPKVEPLDDSRWEDDALMSPNLSNDSPPASPRTPLLSGEAKPFSGLKLGRPFKGSLKRSQEKKHVSEDDDTHGDAESDGKGPKSNLTGRRSIKWLDNHGEDLIQVKEFEASDHDESSEEDEPSSALCTCVIQ